MALDRMIFAFAGVMILLSLSLALTVHIYWLGLAAFVGVNMLQAAFTGFCPLAIMLKKIGVKPGKAFS
ncbi:MAG: sulfurtransferase [Alphaproteobacteria bacterium]|nr:MAG: sulfurtransferase [Alphaproteobacteria bacterium]